MRFVVGPDGAVIPDLARKLPSRGMWVAADRASVATAAKKGLFARAARRAVHTPPDLAAVVETALLRRLLAGLGLARKAGDLVMGFEKVAGAIAAGRAAIAIEALDGAPDGRRKLMQVIARVASPPRLVGLFTREELGLALGAENVIHVALAAGRGAERWAVDVQRLAGFRPIYPDDWAT